MGYVKKLLSLWFWIIPIAAWTGLGYLLSLPIFNDNLTCETLGLLLILVAVGLLILAIYETIVVIANWDW